MSERSRSTEDANLPDTAGLGSAAGPTATTSAPPTSSDPTSSDPTAESANSARSTRSEPSAGPGALTSELAEFPEMAMGRLRVALGVAGVGALLLAVGPLFGVVGSAGNNQGGPGPVFASAPLLIVLAVLPVLAALAFKATGRPKVAAGVLAAAALVAPGRALVDLQVAVDSTRASRPELFSPTTLVPLPPSTGLWLLLAGHVAVTVAGLVAVGATAIAAGPGSLDRLARPRQDAGPALPTGRRSLLAGALFAGLFAAVGLLGAPFTSTNPYLLGDAPLDSPALALVGGLLVAVAAVLGAVLAATAADQSTARGGLLGTAIGIVAVAAPPVAAGLVVDALRPTWGPVLALLAGLALAGLSWLLLDRAANQVDPASPTNQASPTNRASSADGSRSSTGHAQPVIGSPLPGLTRLHTAAGAFGVSAAAAALVGAFAGLLTMPAGAPELTNYVERPLVPAGLLVGLLSVLVLVPRTAAAVRPALVVSLATLPLVAAGVLDTVITATVTLPTPIVNLGRVGGAITPGPGLWFTVLALVLALVSACCAGLAGSVEREETDHSAPRHREVALAVAGATALFAVGTFGLPTLRASGYVAAGLWTDFRITSWGLLIGLVAVVAATGLALRSRPARGVALLLGAAGVVGVRLLDLPLTGGRAANASAGPGTWLAAACLVALLVTALVVGQAARRAARS